LHAACHAAGVLHSTAVVASVSVPSAVTIAIADATDIPEIQRLADEIWRRHYPGIITDAQIDYMLAAGYSSEALTDILRTPEGGLAVARSDGRAVGFGAWRPATGAREMKLERLYVLPQHHGTGIGRALIEHIVARARKGRYAAVVLNVNRRNTEAIAAYERCAFRIRERGDFPIGNGFVMEDYVMVRDLEDA
jgi:ribosomal protein S18 acetylase RimI-like enzyme